MKHWLKYVRCCGFLLLIGLCNGAFDFYEVKYGTYGVSLMSDAILEQTVELIPNADGTVSIAKTGETGMVINNKNKTKFLCKISPINIAQLKDRHTNLVPLLIDVSLNNVTDALSFLKNTCVRKTVGWWTYELCYGRLVKQYHVEDGKIVDAPILLGHYAYDLDWNNRTDVFKKFQNTKQTVYHTQMYENGTMCDLVNRYRQTEVRFFCDNEFQGAYLYSVDEPSSCQYVFNVHCSTLCNLKAFLPLEVKPEAAGIRCHPLLSNRQFQLYQEQIEKNLHGEEAEQEKSPRKEMRNNIGKSKRTNPVDTKESEELDKRMEEQSRQLERAFKKEPYVNVDLNLLIGDDASAELLDDSADLNNAHQRSDTDVTGPIALDDDEEALLDMTEGMSEIKDNDSIDKLLDILSDAYNRADGEVADKLDDAVYNVLKRWMSQRSAGVSVRPKNPFLDQNYLFGHRDKKQEVYDDQDVSEDVNQKRKVKVKVNVEKIQTVGIPLEERGKVISSTQRLEKQIQSTLSKSGIYGASKKIKVKLLTPHQPHGTFDMFNREEMKLFTDVLSSMLANSEFQRDEKKQHERLQRNYDLSFPSSLTDDEQDKERQQG